MSATISFRTPTQLVVKIVTVHVVTAANIAYFSSLQRRSSRGWLPVVRVVFFLFIPPLIIVEIAFNALRALINYVRDAVDDDNTHILFSVCAALGMHASQLKSDDLDSGKQKLSSVSLLEIDSFITNRKAKPVSWVWFGQILISTFTLAQAVGSIVMWGRRISESRGYCFYFDTRNGLMGMMSCAASIESLLILLLRMDWELAQPLPPGNETTPRWQQTQMLVLACTSLCVHRIVYREAVDRELVGFWRFCTPSGLIIELISLVNEHSLWQTILLVLFIVIFRKEIMRSVRSWTGGEVSGVSITYKRWRRVMMLVYTLLFFWIAFDAVFMFVIDIIEVVIRGYTPPESDEGWWQDPLSDAFPVL